MKPATAPVDPNDTRIIGAGRLASQVVVLLVVGLLIIATAGLAWSNAPDPPPMTALVDDEGDVESPLDDDVVVGPGRGEVGVSPSVPCRLPRRGALGAPSYASTAYANRAPPCGEVPPMTSLS